MWQQKNKIEKKTQENGQNQEGGLTMKNLKLTPCVFFLLIGFISFSSSAVAQTKLEKASSIPIKIGYLTALTGVYAAIGTDMRDGFLLYLDQKGNQMASRNVEVKVEDAEGRPDVGLTKAKKLVERDNVHMLAGIIHSGVAQAVAGYAIGQKKVLFINNAGSDALTQGQFNPYIFRNSMANSQQPHPLGEWAYKKGYRKASLIASDYTAGYEWVGGFARTFTQAGGTIIQEQYSPLGAPDPAPFVAAIRPDADVVYAFLAGADALRFVPAYSQYGVKKRTALLGQPAIVDDSILPQLGENASGVVTSGHYTSSIKTPANKAFLMAFQKKFNRVGTIYAEQGYGAAMMLNRALETMKGNIEDTEALIRALEKVEIPDSPRGPVKFDKYHNSLHNIYITEVKRVDGQLVNEIIETYKEVSQFWKWSPEEYLKMPTYISMKGKWAK